MSLKSLIIKNFKSILDIHITDIPNFSVFAGANGSGKSNLFEALEFIKDVVKYGAKDAIRKHGGYDSIRSYKLKSPKAKVFGVFLTIDINENHYKYMLVIRDLDSEPTIYEQIRKNGKVIAKRLHKNSLFVFGKKQDINYSSNESILKLIAIEGKELFDYLSSIVRYQIDPIKAKEADDFDADEALNSDASNISTVLNTLEKDNNIRDEIMETMAMIVPNLDKIVVEKERLNNKSLLMFKEKNSHKRFPARLISDGTIYALAMLAIIYSNKKGLVLIEEPERGLNPQAIMELIEIFRDKSSELNIFINTHSESIVRVLEPRELFLVDKKEGKTEIKNIQKSFPNYDYSKIGIDKMWMSNMFDGGLPW